MHDALRMGVGDPPRDLDADAHRLAHRERTLPELLRQRPPLVIDALEKRRYKPATLGGKPVEVNYNFKITLKLPD
jgi:hypothetical protein